MIEVEGAPPPSRDPFLDDLDVLFGCEDQDFAAYGLDAPLPAFTLETLETGKAPTGGISDVTPPLALAPPIQSERHNHLQKSQSLISRS
jgi:hypothetical protein